MKYIIACAVAALVCVFGFIAQAQTVANTAPQAVVVAPAPKAVPTPPPILTERLAKAATQGFPGCMVYVTPKDISVQFPDGRYATSTPEKCPNNNKWAKTELTPTGIKSNTTFCEVDRKTGGLTKCTPSQ